MEKFVFNAAMDPVPFENVLENAYNRYVGGTVNSFHRLFGVSTLGLTGGILTWNGEIPGLISIISAH